MNKLSFIKENFKKGKSVILLENNWDLWRICELLETYDEGLKWIGVQRNYRNGVFSPIATGLNIKALKDYVADVYVITKEF